MAERIGFAKVKQALFDIRFRLSLPDSLQEDVAKFLNNPGCSCNGPIYRRVLKEAGDQLKAYFPTLEYVSPDQEAVELSNNHWSVINCHVDELEAKLRKLPPGRKQVAVSRFEDQVTVVVNELDVIL